MCAMVPAPRPSSTPNSVSFLAFWKPLLAEAINQTWEDLTEKKPWKSLVLWFLLVLLAAVLQWKWWGAKFMMDALRIIMSVVAAGAIIFIPLCVWNLAKLVHARQGSAPIAQQAPLALLQRPDAQVIPCCGQAPLAALNVTNNGEPDNFRAQARIVRFRLGGKEMKNPDPRVFDLAWADGGDRHRLVRGQSGNLVVARYREERHYALAYLALIQAWGINEQEFTSQRWTLAPREDTPEYEIEVRLFSDKAEAPIPVLFAVGVGTPFGGLTMNRRPLPSTAPAESPAPQITAKLIRRHFLSSSWAGPMAMEVMRVAGRPNEKFTFDVLSELFLVNESCDVTVKAVRAEAELPNEGWVRMTQQRDLGDYQLILGNNRQDRRNLDNLMDKIDGVVLKRGIGYRGWLRFQLRATEEQTKGSVNVKMWIVDALGAEHGITLAAENEIDPSAGELAYSLRHLGG